MALRHKTKSYNQALVDTIKFVVSNPVFKISIVPIILLSVAAAKFGVYVLIVIGDIERYLCNDIKKDSSFNLMIRYMTTPLYHYALIFVNQCIVSFYIQTIIKESFVVFTREYILVNYDKFHSLGSGQIHSLIERRMTAISEFLKVLILCVFHDLCYICMAFYEMYVRVDEKAFYANIGLFTFYLISIHYIIKMRSAFRLKYNDSYNKVSNKSYGILVNYDVIKSYNNEEYELKKLDEALNEVESRGIVFDTLTSFSEFVQKNSLVVPNGLILFLGLRGIFFTKLTNKDGFILYNKLFLTVKTKIGEISTDLLKVTQYLTDISDSRIVEEKLDNDLKGLDIDKFNKNIVFSNVSFGIQNTIIASNINLTINKGDKIAIIGKNGSGKSTFLNVLLRMRNYEGSIKIDDQEMRSISKVSQRDLISYIPQNPSISEGTVLENLVYGNSDISNDKVIEYCTKYGTHEIFSNLQDGYETKAGEMGKYLSGGQKQRISFMRGVIKNGDIFILDEPTSNLDTKSEGELIEYFFTSLKYKTSIMILHNPKYLQKFNRIFGFHNGNINVYNKYEDYLRDSNLY
ncbi:hypothetical protein P3W45_001722 [Vairimorpha bombi]|jgi:ABC-type multidrug transport system fused ATPase/permease subunit